MLGSTLYDEKLLFQIVDECKENISAQHNVLKQIAINSDHQLQTYNYLTDQNECFLKDIYVFINLSESQEPSYALAIIRIVLNRLAKIYYLYKKTQSSPEEVQEVEKIVKKEILRINKRFFEMSNYFNDTYSAEKFREKFDNINKSGNCDIIYDIAKRIDSFPNDFSQLIALKPGIESVIDISGLKSIYDISSEFLHGNSEHLFIRQNFKIFNILVLVDLLRNIMEINDHFINNSSSKEKTHQLTNKYKDIFESIKI